MPRKPRFNLIGIPQHVIQRDNNREPCFLSRQDYQSYLDDLAESAIKYQCKIHAYVLMTNHVHFLVTPFKEHGVSELMCRHSGDATFITSIKPTSGQAHYGKVDINQV